MFKNIIAAIIVLGFITAHFASCYAWGLHTERSYRSGTYGGWTYYRGDRIHRRNVWVPGYHRGSIRNGSSSYGRSGGLRGGK